MLEIVAVVGAFSTVIAGGLLLMKWKRERQFWEQQKKLEYELYRCLRQGKTV